MTAYTHKFEFDEQGQYLACVECYINNTVRRELIIAKPNSSHSHVTEKIKLLISRANGTPEVLSMLKWALDELVASMPKIIEDPDFQYAKKMLSKHEAKL